MLKIKVPATTANIGSGFDSLGAALTMYSIMTFDKCDEKYQITGCIKKYANKNNLVYVAYLKTFEHFNEEPINICIDIDSNIPTTRGLGSSAACIVGGVAGALYMMGKDLDKELMLALSTMIEGHPDNVSPAIYGGMTASLKSGDKVYSKKYPVNEKLVFYAIIPSFTLSTADSRGVLPDSIDLKDAVFNMSRIPLLLKGFEENNKDLIHVSVQDMLHQPYRKELIPEYDLIEKACYDFDAHAVYLSGAGPTMMCIADEPGKQEVLENYVKGFEGKWIIKELKIDEEGIQILRS